MRFSEFVISSENSTHHCCWHSIEKREAAKTEGFFFVCFILPLTPHYLL